MGYAYKARIEGEVAGWKWLDMGVGDGVNRRGPISIEEQIDTVAALPVNRDVRTTYKRKGFLRTLRYVLENYEVTSNGAKR